MEIPACDDGCWVVFGLSGLTVVMFCFYKSLFVHARLCVGSCPSVMFDLYLYTSAAELPQPIFYEVGVDRTKYFATFACTYVHVVLYDGTWTHYTTHIWFKCMRGCNYRMAHAWPCACVRIDLHKHPMYDWD